MLSLYTGTPGSGKSLHLMRIIENKLIKGGNVICNFPIKESVLKKKARCRFCNFFFVRDDDLTVAYLMDFAKRKHSGRNEGQTLIVIDESQRVFNSRDFSRSDRRQWIDFFSLHRHFFFNVILVSQMDRMIDRQVRGLVEYEVKHRKLNNNGFIGKMIPFPCFIAITTWYGAKVKVDDEIYYYNKRLGNLYDSYALFDI